MKHSFLFAGLAIVAGCTFEPPVPSEDGCGAASYSDFLGRDASSLDLPTDRPVRVVPPGAMVTMDYRADRVNIETDAFGIVTAITCG